MSKRITVNRIGVIYLNVDFPGFRDARFPCTYIHYGMAINSIPTFTATTSSGRPVRARGAFVRPERLFGALQAAQLKDSVTRLTPCRFVEDRSDMGLPNRIIFEGFIASCSLTFEAKENGSCSVVRFDCLGKAAALSCAPVASYMEASLSSIMRHRGGDPDITLERAMQSNSGSDNSGGGSFRFQLKRLMKDKDIVHKCAIAIAYLRNQATMHHLGEAKEIEAGDADFLNAFGGQTKLKKLSQFCDSSYSEQIVSTLWSSVQLADIYTSVQAMLCSTEYMLQLVPRWSCDSHLDFKTEIMPVTAWAPRNTLNLTAAGISGISFPYNASSQLNVPDVFFVRFDSALSSAGAEDSSGERLCIRGVAAKDKQLEEALRATALNEGMKELYSSAKVLRFKEWDAPQWLAMVVSNPNMQESPEATLARDTGKVVSQPKSIAQQAHPGSLQQANTVKTKKEVAQDIANEIATTFYNHLYLSENKCILRLSLGYRFGDAGVLLENSLGDTVNVSIGGELFQHIRLVGVLESLEFEASLGESSTGSYTAVLNSVRLASVPLPRVECPIYSIGPKVS